MTPETISAMSYHEVSKLIGNAGDKPINEQLALATQMYSFAQQAMNRVYEHWLTTPHDKQGLNKLLDDAYDGFSHTLDMLGRIDF